MKQYLAQLTEILKDGEVRTDRTGTGTKSIFGMQTRYNLRDGFPAVTTKKLAWRSVVSELLWFLEGSTDERRLCEILHGTRDPSKSTIWSANADAQGVALGYRNDDDVKELGPVYGAQWRDWGSDASRSGEHTDQITSLINQLRHQPHSRRHILSAWNVGDVPDMALPPCHVMAQFYVSNNDELSCQLYQRSADMFLGVPFNIASYALLTHILAQLTGLKVGDFVHTIGDAHIYLNHIDQVKLQLCRTPFDKPTLIMPAFTTLDEVLVTEVDDFKFLNYHSHQTIKAPMAV
jgi:thymidylate synthase